MKKLFAVLCCIPSLAFAEAWSTPNEGGGEIVITDRACTYGGKTYDKLREAYGYSGKGYIEGCWTYVDGLVRIVWKNSDGTADTRVYKLENFQQKESTPRKGA